MKHILQIIIYKEKREEEEEVQHLGGSFFTALYVQSICSSTFFKI